MNISAPEIKQQENQVVYSAQIESPHGKATLWYSLEKKYADFLTTFSDAALAALLMPAMANGEDIHISGTVSAKLFYNLSSSYQRFLQCFFPQLRQINIYPENIQAGNQRASGVATGFTGGIDSYFLLAVHHFPENLPEGYRISHLLFNNTGTHGHGKEGERVFLERYSHLKPAAEQIGLPFIAVNSNMDSFYDEGLGFVDTLVHRHATVPLVLQGGIGRYLYASAVDYKEVVRGHTDDMDYYETIALPLLSTDTLDSYTSGSEFTRTEKTLRVAEIPESYSTLHVCYSRRAPENCSSCSKCMRTMFTLDIAGLIDRYSAVFDLHHYRKKRGNYIMGILAGHDLFHRDILEFAWKRHYAIPLYLRIASLVYRPLKTLQKQWKRSSFKRK